MDISSCRWLSPDEFEREIAPRCLGPDQDFGSRWVGEASGHEYLVSLRTPDFTDTAMGILHVFDRDSKLYALPEAPLISAGYLQAVADTTADSASSTGRLSLESFLERLA